MAAINLVALLSVRSLGYPGRVNPLTTYEARWRETEDGFLFWDLLLVCELWMVLQCTLAPCPFWPWGDCAESFRDCRFLNLHWAGAEMLNAFA